MNKAIIVDLDGTLCNTQHRKHFMEQTPKDWESFYAGIIDDEPNSWCRYLIETFRQEHEYPEIILVSGRPEEHLITTTDWLDEYDISYDRLFMRKSGDFREDFIIKQEIYDEYIKDKYDVIFAIDDRKQVVDMWRRNGITCLQCAEGNF